jgi:hypothetical protein
VKAHRVVRRRGPNIFSRQSAHRRRWGCQPYAPAALYPPGRSWYSFLLEAESVPGLERLGKLNKSNDLIGNRTRDLPACSIVPQPTMPPRAPKVIKLISNPMIAVQNITRAAIGLPLDGQEYKIVWSSTRVLSKCDTGYFTYFIDLRCLFIADKNSFTVPVFRQHVMKTIRRRKEVKLYAFFTSALDKWVVRFTVLPLYPRTKISR